MLVNVSKPNSKVTCIEINRPERRNAVDGATASALLEAFEAFEADQESCVAVFTGVGGNFCAGADLKAIASGERRHVAEDGPGPMGPTRMQLSKPVIAAIEGYAVAGGLELALWSDLRVVSEQAKLGVFCRRFGVPLIDLGTIMLPRIVGHGRAMDLILTGREVGAKEALQMGLVNRVVPEGDALQKAIEMATELAQLPQQCMRNDRMSAIASWDLSRDEALRFEIQKGLDTLSSGETLSGAMGFSSGDGRHGSKVAKDD